MVFEVAQREEIVFIDYFVSQFEGFKFTTLAGKRLNVIFGVRWVLIGTVMNAETNNTFHHLSFF